ncbi:MAG: hypothetical protein HOF34_07820, partial [Rhodospirillaceae bacterium]|nr:hypothetical protein [Rhodospirillaceae bacterium]
MTELSLFQQNLIFLDAALPGVASLARRSTDTITQPVLDETGRAIDIDIGGARLYNQNAIDFARAHELDPVSHIITTTYANFMMEQAGQMWMDPEGESQREALSLAHRVLAANPSDGQLLARCSRFLDLPQTHALRQTP